MDSNNVSARRSIYNDKRCGNALVLLMSLRSLVPRAQRLPCSFCISPRAQRFALPLMQEHIRTVNSVASEMIKEVEEQFRREFEKVRLNNVAMTHHCSTRLKRSKIIR